jgi:hypothetical protein
MKSFLLALLVAAALSLSGAGLASEAKSPHPAPVRECTPPFPYSCTTVRWAVKTFSRSYLEAQGKKRGMTACHKATAIACINGAP